MTNKNYTMDNVTSIVKNRETEEYTVNYKWESVAAYDVKLPVYTAEENTSRVLSATTPTTRTHTLTANAIVSENVARAMGRAFRNAGRIGTVEDVGVAIIQNINPPSAKRLVAIGDETGITATAPDWAEIDAQQESIAADNQLSITFC